MPRKSDFSIQRIATGMGRLASTVSCELGRNAGQRGCRHKQAGRKARERLKATPKCVRMTPEAMAFMEARLADGWSPEQIGGRMKATGRASVSHRAIAGTFGWTKRTAAPYIRICGIHPSSA